MFNSNLDSRIESMEEIINGYDIRDEKYNYHHVPGIKDDIIEIKKELADVKAMLNEVIDHVYSEKK